MKVLVTGASGFVGRHVVTALLSKSHSVTAVARDEARARSMSWIEDVTFIARDIHQPRGENTFQAFGEPDVIMHLAWPGLPDYRRLTHFEHTLFADYGFLKSLLDSGAKHLLVTGTCFEYGLRNGCLAEDTPTSPVTPYGLAKDTLRRFLEFATRDTGAVFQWARLFYMYGPGQHAGSLLSQLERAIERREDSFNMSAGEQLRDYLPVEQVAANLVTLAEHPQCTGVVNVCSGEPISVRRLVERHLAERESTMRLNLGHYPYPDHEPMEFWGNPSKLRSAISTRAQ